MMFLNCQKPGLIGIYVAKPDSIMPGLEDDAEKPERRRQIFSVLHALKSIDYRALEVVRINSWHAHWKGYPRLCGRRIRYHPYCGENGRMIRWKGTRMCWQPNVNSDVRRSGTLLMSCRNPAKACWMPGKSPFLPTAWSASHYQEAIIQKISKP